MSRFITLLSLFLLSLTSFAQTTKPDVIIKQNGEEMSGKILEITDTDVKFSYTGETVVYVLKKSEIAKINFSSGRTQVFNQPGAAAPAETVPPTSAAEKKAAMPSRGGDPHNLVAILPFAFLKDGQYAADELSEKAQDECYSYMNKHAGTLTILDPQTTNTYLLKAGVTKENIKQYTSDELCQMLSVEYVVAGSIMQNKGAQTSSQSGSYNDQSKTKDNNSDSKTNNNKEEKSSGYSSTYSSTQQNYESTVVLKIFNDKGATLYNEQRKGLLASTSQDAYVSTLQYLLKRTPLYHK